jgi:hypothetical protein
VAGGTGRKFFLITGDEETDADVVAGGDVVGLADGELVAELVGVTDGDGGDCEVDGVAVGVGVGVGVGVELGVTAPPTASPSRHT